MKYNTAKPRPIPSKFKDIFSYNPDTGLLKRKVRLGKFQKNTLVGNPKKNGYLQVEVDKKAYYVHRICYYLATGKQPIILDHINHDVADNRISNLRNCTIEENNRNRVMHSTNTSGVKGVYKHSSCNGWVAQINLKNKTISLGLFKKFNDAVKARLQAEKKHYKDFANPICKCEV